MSNKPVHKGPHQYERFTQKNGSEIWRCVLGCSHFLREYEIRGREAKCPRCGESYVMGKHEITLRKPHCKNCTRSTKPRETVIEALPEESPL